MATPQRKPVARSTTHRVAFANKPRAVRGNSDCPKPESTVEQFMRLSEQLWQNSEEPRSDTGTLSTAQKTAEMVTAVHVQSVPVTPLTSVQAVTPRKPAPQVGPTPITIHPGNFVASMEQEDLDTPPFTAQERLIYVPVDTLNTRVGALLDSGCIDNFISRTTTDQLGLTRYPLKTAIGMQMANVDKAYVDHFVRPVLRIGDLRARLALKNFDTPIHMILGYTFLRVLRLKPD